MRTISLYEGPCIDMKIYLNPRHSNGHMYRLWTPMEPYLKMGANGYIYIESFHLKSTIDEKIVEKKVI